MKNYFKIIGLSTLFFAIIISCKKQENEANGNSLHQNTEINPVKDSIDQANAGNQNKNQPMTTLALSENAFDFGIIKKGDKVEHTYEVTNTGKNPLVISSVKPGCGCTVSDFTKEPILPRQKGKIILKFNSSNFDGLVHKSAEVFANTEKTPIQLTFSANIK